MAMDQKRIEKLLDAITEVVDAQDRGSTRETAKQIAAVASESELWEVNLEEFLSWWNDQGEPA